MVEFGAQELAELHDLMHHARKAHVRRKATALWNLAQGRTAREVASFLDVSRVSLLAWRKRFRSEGVAGFEIKPGRGRPQQARGEEIETVLRQSPRSFGMLQNRWTLQTLAQVVPSLKGFSPPGVRKALQRHGFHYKRGQPHLHSPDPQYELKRGDWSKRFEKPATIPGT